MASLQSPVSPNASPTKLGNGTAHRPSAPRHVTAPPGTMNGHFALVGDAGAIDFDHGVQVIDEEKEFKYVAVFSSRGEHSAAV